MIDIHQYIPPGPVAARFINSDNKIDCLMGPIRSGKTVSGLYKRLRRALSFPACTDGVHRYSFLVVRESYAQLYATTIKSWHDIFPADVGEFRGTEGRPAEHKLVFEQPFPLEITGRFVSIQNDSIENVARGAEYSDVLLEEADLLDPGVKLWLQSRIGQYPKKKMIPEGVEISGQLDLITNPPDTDSYIYGDFAENLLPLHALYQQPSGLSPEAENLHNINRGRVFYEELAAANPRWWVERMVHGRFGASRSGEAVYPEYDDIKHCGNEVLAVADCPIRIGLDQNLTNPAAVVSQWLPSGQWRVVNEFVPGRMGASAFGGALRDFLNREFHGLPIALATADPAAAYGADREHGELAWYEAVAQQLGIPVQLAPTNEPSARQDAVRQLLTAPDILLPNGLRVPTFKLSARCRILRKGFISHYRFRKHRSGDKAVTPEVDKTNGASDPQDALQYDVLNSRGRLNVVHAKVLTPKAAMPRTPPAGPRPRPGDFDVFGV